MRVEERAYAKVNLGLKVLGKRSDGYHEILTVMQTVSLWDRVVLEEGNGVSLACSDPEVPEGPDNLAYKAAESFRKAFGISRGVRIYLWKHIPVGAGLGGGSSDAAAVLRGLCELWGIRPDFRELEKLAASLGSDVPFLLRPGTAVARGRGEVLKYMDWPFDVWYVLVYPGFGVSTRWAYGQVGKTPLTSGREYFNLVSLLENGIPLPEDFWGILENDFELVVEKEYPQVRWIKRRLGEEGSLIALLSGSGSTVFGVFSGRDKAKEAAGDIKKEGFWTVVCRPVEFLEV